jgi:NAD(P)-dependent dehydrogenase (short-subunit alcohol dehydrogenase family)
VESVLITGANRGIGLEVSRRYAAAGNRVFACCREPSRAAELAALAKSHKQLTIHGVHVADGESVAGLANEIGTVPLDILINNAGMSGPAITSQMGALAVNMNVMYAYCSSKAAVNKVMKMAAGELANDGIAVSLIHPGWVRTDMGGPGADISVAESAEGIMAVIADTSLANTGSFRKWNGAEHPW